MHLGILKNEEAWRRLPSKIYEHSQKKKKNRLVKTNDGYFRNQTSEIKTLFDILKGEIY